MISGNPYLEIVGRPESVKLGEMPSLRVSLAGISPVTHKQEQVDLYIVGIADDHLFYDATVVPAPLARQHAAEFARVLNSVKLKTAR
jgi:hypothetical protein